MENKEFVGPPLPPITAKDIKKMQVPSNVESGLRTYIVPVSLALLLFGAGFYIKHKGGKK